MVRWPKKIDQFHAGENPSESTDDAKQNVARCDAKQPSAQKKKGFVTESREGGESAEDAGKEKEADQGRKEIMMFCQSSEDTNREAAEKVDNKCAHRELPRLGVMQYQATEFVTSDRTNSASKRNDSNLFYSKHRTDSCFIAGVISLLGSSSSHEERQTPLPGRTIAETTHPATLLPILF